MTVRIGDVTRRMRARRANAEERERYWPRLLAVLAWLRRHLARAILVSALVLSLVLAGCGESSESTAAPSGSDAQPGSELAAVANFEDFNQYEVHPWVAEAGVPAVAAGDFQGELPSERAAA